MGLGGELLKASKLICPFCNKPLYADPNDRRKKHSTKDFIRCLHDAHVVLSEAVKEIDGLKKQKEVFEKTTVDSEGNINMDDKDIGKLKEKEKLDEG